MTNQSEDLTSALELMEAALELLDRASVAADVGAHLDLAISRLKTLLALEQLPWPISAERIRS
jgi:hypothetical protein